MAAADPPGENDASSNKDGEDILEGELVDIRNELVRKFSEITERPPEESKAEVLAEIAVGVIRHESYRGPLPSGKILADLGKVDQSFPDRAFKFAEKEQAHRHEVNNLQAQMVSRNQWMDFTVAAGSRILGAIIALTVIGVWRTSYI